MAGNLVKFIYVPTASTYDPTTFEDNVIYFVEKEKAIYKGKTAYNFNSASATDLTELKTLIGTLPAGEEATLVEYINNQVAAAKKAGTDAQTSVDTLDKSLAAVAKSGNASDVKVTAITNLKGTNVQAVLEELAEKSHEKPKIALTKQQTPDGNDTATYDLTVGGTSVGKVNIPKDMVATSGKLVKPTTAVPIKVDNQSVTSGTYIEMTIANGSPFYINVADLIEYNAVADTDEVALTDEGHIIKATIKEVPASKVAVGSGESKTSLDKKLTDIDNALGSGGSVDTQIDNKIAELDADVDAVKTGTSADAVAVVTGVTEVDGKITAVDSVDVDKAGTAQSKAEAVLGSATDTADMNTVYGAQAAAKAAQTTADTAKANADKAQTSADEAAAKADAVLGTESDLATANTVYGAKKYADSLAGNYATAAQGTKADSAVQSVKSGTANGTIAVDGTDVAVTGLGTAAYAAADSFDAAGAATTAETNAKTYADDLAKNYDVAGAAASAQTAATQAAKDYTDSALTWGTL